MQSDLYLNELQTPPTLHQRVQHAMVLEVG
jgi:hypothetical protein